MKVIKYMLLNLVTLTLCITASSTAQSPDKKPSVSKAPPTEIRIDQSAGWPRPRSDERKPERRVMVDRQLAARDISDKTVLDAMMNVPRHWFVPAEVQSYAYADRPLPIAEEQTISQPYIVAFMTQALKLDRHSKVLEVGTGSGYQAAVLAEITPHVYSIEIVEPLGRSAKATFEKHGYGTIKVRIGDGYAGWKEHAPFDAIIVTCAPQRIPPALIEQLKVGGRICIPVGSQMGGQWLRLVTKTADGKLDASDLLPVRFVPMTGNAQEKAPKD